MAANEEAEAEILAEFLPEQLSEADVADMVDQAVAETGASEPRDMGKVMGALMPRTKGRADGKLVSDLVRRRLGGS